MTPTGTARPTLPDDTVVMARYPWEPTGFSGSLDPQRAEQLLARFDGSHGAPERRRTWAFRALGMVLAVGIATFVLFLAAREHDRYAADDEAGPARARKAPSSAVTATTSSSALRKK